MKLPAELGPIHFVGIGGIGMSGIAEVLLNLGYRVQGSDASDSANVRRLRDKGADVFIGHHAGNLGEAAVVVVSTAIRRDNPELLAAREKRLPVVRRAEMLAELMRLKQCVAIAGTHGKTTTTSMVATLLDKGGFDPTVINGGIINAYGTNARLGAGEWMVVEADESDGTFLKLPADVAIVTNIDPEHLDHFKTFDAVNEAFRNLVENLPFYGFAVMCLDHNALNATAAIAVAFELGMSVEAIRAALAGFGGVKRRFTRTGEALGALIFDDYAHHPVEISAVLRAARASTKGSVIAIVQPHRYTRLQSLFEQFATCFNDADSVIVADVYPAGEKPIEGVDKQHLVSAIKAHGHRNAFALDGPEALPETVKGLVKAGDYVVFLGAGNITQWAYALPEQLGGVKA